ncbi:MAG: hypothetical protein QOJ14_2053 [Thermoleophilaceae bacterium]|nr:hypothetical protein [Thermoleophilaceae bacterium]
MLRFVQHLMLRTNRGPMRALWRLAYRIAARGFAAYVTRGEPGASTYLRGTLASGEALPGLADIDVEVVLSPSAGATDARERVRARFRRVRRALPVLGDLLFDWPSVFEQDDLARAASQTIFTYGLDRTPPAAAYLGADVDAHRTRLLERPELYGPAHAWKRLTGPARPLPEAPHDADSRRLAAWLELQNWWRWAFDACVHPHRPRTAHLCVKLVAEPVRAWLWLVDGERAGGRVAALELGRERLPEHAAAFERALDLYAALPAMPEPPLATILPDFLELSERLGGEIARRVEPAGFTEVRLTDTEPRTLALAHGRWRGEEPLVPLVDWRALVAGQGEPDEAFAIVEGDASDPAVLAALATAQDRGPYPTLCTHGLMLRPAPMGGRQTLRAAQCAATDPVSFALAAGRSTARFPNVRGWSIQDTARRAVAEHAAWLAARSGRSLDRDFAAFAVVVTAARAGLVWGSVEAGEPELPVTVDATLELLGASEAVRASYHEHAVSWVPPDARLVEELRAAVERLPAYAGERRTLAPAP